jgi:hypothetical protein
MGRYNSFPVVPESSLCMREIYNQMVIRQCTLRNFATVQPSHVKLGAAKDTLESDLGKALGHEPKIGVRLGCEGTVQGLESFKNAMMSPEIRAFVV